MGSIQEAQRTQDARHGCSLEVSAPWSWMTPRTSPTWRTSRRSTSGEAQNPWNQEALLEEMPDLATPAPPKGATGPGGDQPVPPQNLDTEEGKLSLLLWAMKRHQGELWMFGGIWKKHSSGEIPKGADQQFKLSPEELLALERRTHPLTCERDHIDPIIHSALEIRARRRSRWWGSSGPRAMACFGRGRLARGTCQA